MMNRSTLVAMLVFVGLAAVTVITMREKPERGITRIDFTGVRPGAVSAVLVEGSNPIEVRKQDGVWMAAGKRADEGAVKRLLDAVAGLESSELVTRNVDRFAGLEVEGEKATRVKVLDGAVTVAEFVIGSASSGGSHVRVGDAVYLARGVSRSTFSRPRTGWLDLTLFRENLNEINKLEVRLRGEPAYALIREGEDWRLEDPSLMPAGHRFDRTAARRLVSTLVAARADDVLDADPGSEASGLTADADTLVFHIGTTEGTATTRSLLLGSSGEKGQVYARASTRDDLVTLPAYLAGNLRKKLGDLRDLTLMSIDAAKVTRLELIAPNKRLIFDHADGTWHMAESSEKASDGFELDDAAVRRRISDLAGVRALVEAPATAPKTTGLDKPGARVLVTTEGGSVTALDFGGETKWNEQGAVFARGNADDRVYLVHTRDRDRLLGGIDTFARREPPPGGLPNLDPEALRNLPPEVRESLLRQLAEQQQRQRLVESLQSGQGAAGK